MTFRVMNAQLLNAKSQSRKAAKKRTKLDTDQPLCAFAPLRLLVESFEASFRANSPRRQTATQSTKLTKTFCILALLLCVYLDQSLFEHPVQLAYIGPGAGIALVGSFLAVLAAMLSAFAVRSIISMWPKHCRVWRRRH